jgi:hypothetical protein
MKNISIITGRIRDEIRAKRTLNLLGIGKTKGIIDEIVFSTWSGELAKHPSILAELLNNKVHVIETQEQSTTFQESHQKIPLLIALSFLDDDCYVTRHRFDRVNIGEDYLTYLKNIKQSGPKNTNATWSPVKNKISVLSAVIDIPFFINDLIFSGMRSDIARVASINPLLQLHWSPHINMELAFFANLFFDSFPLITDYISTYVSPIGNRDDETRRKYKEIQQGSDFFIKIFSLYATIINECFDVGYKYRDYPLPNEPSALRLEETMHSKCDVSDFQIRCFDELGHSYSKSNNFFRTLIEGGLCKSDLNERIISCAENIESLFTSPSKTPRIISPEAILYYNEFIRDGLFAPAPRGTSTLSNGIIKFNSSQLFNAPYALQRNTSMINMGEWENI